MDGLERWSVLLEVWKDIPSPLSLRPLFVLLVEQNTLFWTSLLPD